MIVLAPLAMRCYNGAVLDGELKATVVPFWWQTIRLYVGTVCVVPRIRASAVVVNSTESRKALRKKEMGHSVKSGKVVIWWYPAGGVYSSEDVTYGTIGENLLSLSYFPTRRWTGHF